MINNKALTQLDIDCVSRQLGKNKTLPFLLHQIFTTKPFKLVHTDGVLHLYFFRTKSEVSSMFKAFLVLIKIKILQFDSGREYMSN